VVYGWVYVDCHGVIRGMKAVMTQFRNLHLRRNPDG